MASDERGFYKVSGRKLEPVLGGPRPRRSSVSEQQVYHDERGAIAKEVGSGVLAKEIGGSALVANYGGDDQGDYVKEIGSSISSFGAGPSRISSPTAPILFTGQTMIQPPPPVITEMIPEDSEYEAGYNEIGGRELSTPTPTLPTPPTLPVLSPSPSGRPSMGGLAGRDGLGRSLPSLDGSRTSKFTEDIV